MIPGEKGSTLHSNNPYNTITNTSSTSNDINADARLAQELQAEEDARARSSAPNQNYQTSPPFQQSALQQQGLVHRIKNIKPLLHFNKAHYNNKD